MTNKYFFNFFLLISINCTFCFAQQINTPITAKPWKAFFDVLDESQINIFYNYSVLNNTANPSNKKSSQIILQIGKKYVKCTDIYKTQYDSLIRVYSKLDQIRNKEINLGLATRSKIAFNMDVLHDISKNKYIIQKRIPSSLYEFEINKIKKSWLLKKDFKEVLGYKVQKAILDYGGRKWTAWFTKDISSSYGPYIFGGLPGLILEIYDDQRHYEFTMIGLTKDQKNIYKNNDPENIVLSSDEFYKIEKRFHKRPDLFIVGRTRNPIKTRELPYNPINKM